MQEMQYKAQDGSLQACMPEFRDRVKAKSGANLERCYQCFTCTLGCPVASDMDHSPHQIMRMVQLGMKDAVLRSSTVWRCAACETCVTRCPNEVDIVAVMDVLRQMTVEEKIRGDETAAIANFHELFLDGVRRYGHSYELGLLLRLKLRTKDLFTDVGLGVKMMLKGKLEMLPPKSRSKGDIKRIFEKAKALGEDEA